MQSKNLLRTYLENRKRISSWYAIFEANHFSWVWRMAVPGEPWQKVHETPSQPMAGCGGALLSSQLGGKAQI
jgi:hypothetical protein